MNVWQDSLDNFLLAAEWRFKFCSVLPLVPFCLCDKPITDGTQVFMPTSLLNLKKKTRTYWPFDALGDVKELLWTLWDFFFFLGGYWLLENAWSSSPKFQRFIPFRIMSWTQQLIVQRIFFLFFFFSNLLEKSDVLTFGGLLTHWGTFLCFPSSRQGERLFVVQSQFCRSEVFNWWDEYFVMEENWLGVSVNHLFSYQLTEWLHWSFATVDTKWFIVVLPARILCHITGSVWALKFWSVYTRLFIMFRKWVQLQRFYFLCTLSEHRLWTEVK
jgi:hypothetical protein